MVNPSQAEVMRRLDELFTEFRGLREELKEDYARKDVIEVRELANNVRMAGLETEVQGVHRRIDKAEAKTDINRRLIITAFIAPIIVGIVIALILASLGAPK